MTRPRALLFLPAFAAGLAVGVAMPVLGGSAGSKVTNLLTVTLSSEFTPAREVLIDLVEIPPNQKLDWHWHPGEEFHYYLEGNPVIERVDAPPIIGKPGTVGHVAFKQRHQATAGDEGAKILVFRVHTKGEPWRYLDETEDTPHLDSKDLGAAELEVPGSLFWSRETREGDGDRYTSGVPSGLFVARFQLESVPVPNPPKPSALHRSRAGA